jgi:hypothetical protein
MSASSIPWTVGFVHWENVCCRSPWSAGRQNHAKRADSVVMNFAVRRILLPSSEFPERPAWKREPWKHLSRIIHDAYHSRPNLGWCSACLGVASCVLGYAVALG